jgi:hypothetical protein
LSRLTLLALVDARPPAPVPGASGETLRFVAAGAILAAVTKAAAPPRPDEAALRAHDAAVRRLFAQVPALLPARFGETFADETDLFRCLADRQASLETALASVRGCVQMNLRVFGEPARREADEPSQPTGAEATAAHAPSEAAHAPSEAGPGARYLRRRAEAFAQARALPELAPFRPALAPWIVDERVSRHDRGRLLATAWHLVRRDDVAAYRKSLDDAADRAEPGTTRLLCSGPFPPYAFAEAAP